MRVVRNKKPLPRLWQGLPGADRALYIGDVTLGGRSIKMKLLVFRTNRDLVRFWKLGLGHAHLCKHTRGVVNQLRTTHENPTTGKQWMQVDPVYFAVMGLLITHLGQEVIAHESNHAGFAYAKRLGSRSQWYDDDNEEEEVCYATGKIASAVNHILHQNGLYELYQKHLGKLPEREKTKVWRDIKVRQLRKLEP